MYLMKSTTSMSKLQKCTLTEIISPILSATGYNSYAESDHIGRVSTSDSRLYLLLLVMHVPMALILQMQPLGLQDAIVQLTTFCCLKVVLSKGYHYVNMS